MGVGRVAAAMPVGISTAAGWPKCSPTELKLLPVALYKFAAITTLPCPFADCGERGVFSAFPGDDPRGSFTFSKEAYPSKHQTAGAQSGAQGIDQGPDPELSDSAGEP